MLGVSVFAFAIPLVALQTKTSGILLGAAFSGYFLAKLISSPIAGKLSDTVGPQKVLLTAVLAGCISPIPALFSQQHQVLLLMQFCMGLSAGTIKPVATAVIAQQTPARLHGKLFGICNGIYTAAFFLAPLIGGILFYNRELQNILYFLMTSMLASFCIIFQTIPADIRTAFPKTSPHIPVLKHTNGLTKSTLLLAIGGRTACTACLITFYPALLSGNLHGPSWLVGALFALPSVIACTLSPFGGKLADRYNKEILTVAGMVTSACALMLTGHAETALEFSGIGIMLGIGTSLSFPASMSLASSLDTRQGLIMGWFHGAANVGFVLGPLACGFLVEHYANISTALQFIGISGVITTLPLAMHRRFNQPHTLMIMASALIVCLLGLTQIHIATPNTPPKQATPIQEKVHTYAGVAMGNVVHLTVRGVSSEKGGKSSQAAFKTIAQLESDFGHRNSSGSVGKVNLAAGSTPQRVTPETFSLLSRALDICKKSSGVFDITIGAITTLPYYYQEKAEKDKAALVNFRKIQMDPQKQTVFLPQSGMALDLGGLAKGTVLDGAARTLQRQGVPSALVEAGGDLYCYGKHSWKVGIQNPRGEGLLGIITVSNAGVCGSGDYYQFSMVKENGKEKRKHHILDPALLDSAEKSIAVTVVAPSAELADGLATTLFILGPEKGKTLLTRFPGSSALWVLPDKSIVRSPNFPPLSIE